MKHIGSAWIVASAMCMGNAAWAIDATGWSCTNSTGCGTGTADGVVTNAPVAGSTGYAWVSTAYTSATPPNFPLAQLPSGVPTTDSAGAAAIFNGATYTSGPFAAQANAPISFFFNYITSDGGKFSDFAWARLLDDTGAEVALLFTARTDPTVSVVPGNEMPAHQATLTPASVPINGVIPTWAPLGTVNSGSGDCFNNVGQGCGFSDWVKADYTIAQAGTYRLEIGVVNWADTAYQSGLAVDGLLVAGLPPSTLTLANPGNQLSGAIPTYSGTVGLPGAIPTVDLVVTGPNGYTANLQAPILNSAGSYTYSVQGAGLTPGVYTVVATLTGTSQTQTVTFTVTAAQVAPVPGLGEFGLGVLGLTLAALGLRRRTR